MLIPAARSEVFAFGPFRLDVLERRLERAGEPVRLRAKLFDTLVVLVRRAGRLVAREELLAEVWPDAIVEEGNLSHNVSALRKALGDGEQAEYIETIPRQGYRFVHALESLAALPRAAESELERARRFYAEGAWEQAFAEYARAAGAAPLSGDDGAQLAEAACWSGRYDELVPLLESAAEAYRREARNPGAARTALRLATVLLDRRRVALASSYVRQAERLLEGCPESARERAELERVRGRLRWADGDWEGGLAHARRAAELAHDLGARDTEALARSEMGHSLLVLGRFVEAIDALQEAGAIVMAGGLGPYAAGITLCGLIHAWRACGRLDRAAEWVEASSRWTDETGLTYFPGLCRVHRGELTCLRGDLERAEADLEHGTRELHRADSANAGPAFRELGSVRLLRGDLAGAEAAFGRALEFGTDPQPGLARLLAARGETLAARRELERFFSAEGGAERNLLDREYRFEALAAYVSLALATGERDAARAAADELAATARATGSEYHRTTAEGAAGELALAEGRGADALRLLRESWRGWTNLKTPHAAARAREWLGLALLAEGDRERARMELEGAAAGFERMGAALDLRRVLARLPELDGTPARAPRIVTSGRVLGADQLRALLGDEGWADLTGWLERTLTRCWHDHGGTTLSAAEGRFTVAFRDLESGLGCAAYVQRSLREHRARHGFAPPMRVALADASALGGESDLEALRALAEAQAGSGSEAEVVLVAADAVASASPGVARLREAGVPVRVVGR
jgi:DNA-binding winged helix-turn-helix (wHTH) protein